MDLPPKNVAIFEKWIGPFLNHPNFIHIGKFGWDLPMRVGGVGYPYPNWIPDTNIYQKIEGTIYIYYLLSNLTYKHQTGLLKHQLYTYIYIYIFIFIENEYGCV